MGQASGVVRWWSELGTYGFITEDGQRNDVYVNRNSIAAGSSFEVGQGVRFERIEAPGGLEAINVTREVTGPVVADLRSWLRGLVCRD